MSKKSISETLREGLIPKETLLSALRESMAELNLVKEEGEDSESNDKDNEKTKSSGISDEEAGWYRDIQDSLNKDKHPTAPTMVGVMKEIGIEDDSKGVNRSLFRKKVYQEYDQKFTRDELAKLRSVLGMS
jgi:hypothetical protein